MASKFKIEIDLGNDTMRTGDDVAAALESAARYLRGFWGDQPMGGIPDDLKPRVVRDDNGNRVGTGEVES